MENSREELLPGFKPDFPYISTYAELNRYADPIVPWHWHRAIELFYVKDGCLEYTTPKGKWVFPAGSGGMVNSNILHTSKIQSSTENNVQLLHLFDPSFLGGERGSRIEKQYILPLTAASNIEIIALTPDHPDQAPIIQAIQQAFEISDQDSGYEFRIREALSQIWMKLLLLAQPASDRKHSDQVVDDKIKALMIYIHEHFQDPISIEQLAKSIHISKRTCFRLFNENLHMSPLEYIRTYRMQKACQLLTKTEEPITRVAYACGLGSSSYFGKIFREQFGCSPAQYRRKWHDCNTFRHL